MNTYERFLILRYNVVFADVAVLSLFTTAAFILKQIQGLMIRF